MAEIVGEKGYGAATVAAVCARAQLSRQTFYRRFDSRESCFLAVLDVAYREAGAVIIGAFDSAPSWSDAVREAFASLLVLFETRPGLARVWMIESIAAGPWALEHRERRVHQLTDRDCRALAGGTRARSGLASNGRYGGDVRCRRRDPAAPCNWCERATDRASRTADGDRDGSLPQFGAGRRGNQTR